MYLLYSAVCHIVATNGLNMMRAALCSLHFFGFYIFKFTKSFSMKMKLRHALYFLLATGLYCLINLFVEI